jgi:hypothetical protein
MVTYIITELTLQLENRDDDGETGAGDKVLFMLQRLGAVNILGNR